MAPQVRFTLNLPRSRCYHAAAPTPRQRPDQAFGEQFEEIVREHRGRSVRWPRKRRRAVTWSGQPSTPESASRRPPSQPARLSPLFLSIHGPSNAAFAHGVVTLHISQQNMSGLVTCLRGSLRVRERRGFSHPAESGAFVISFRDESQIPALIRFTARLRRSPEAFLGKLLYRDRYKSSLKPQRHWLMNLELRRGNVFSSVLFYKTKGFKQVIAWSFPLNAWTGNMRILSQRARPFNRAFLRSCRYAEKYTARPNESILSTLVNEESVDHARALIAAWLSWYHHRDPPVSQLTNTKRVLRNALPTSSLIYADGCPMVGG